VRLRQKPSLRPLARVEPRHGAAAAAARPSAPSSRARPQLAGRHSRRGAREALTRAAAPRLARLLCWRLPHSAAAAAHGGGAQNVWRRLAAGCLSTTNHPSLILREHRRRCYLPETCLTDAFLVLPPSPCSACSTRSSPPAPCPACPRSSLRLARASSRALLRAENAR